MESLLDIVAVLIPFILSVLGALVSTSEIKPGLRKQIWILFLIVGIVGSGVTYWQQSRDRASHKNEVASLNDSIDSFKKRLQDNEVRNATDMAYLKGKLDILDTAMKNPKITREDIKEIMQQLTLADMKRRYETLTLGAVASISGNAYTISAIPSEVAAVHLFFQKAGTLGKGTSEFLGSISRQEFPNKISQYETLAKSKHMKLILRTVAKDQTQWLQNQIKYNQKFLKKSKFVDPFTNKISEGEEWPVN